MPPPRLALRRQDGQASRRAGYCPPSAILGTRDGRWDLTHLPEIAISAPAMADDACLQKPRSSGPHAWATEPVRTTGPCYLDTRRVGPRRILMPASRTSSRAHPDTEQTVLAQQRRRKHNRPVPEDPSDRPRSNRTADRSYPTTDCAWLGTQACGRTINVSSAVRHPDRSSSPPRPRRAGGDPAGFR